MLETRKPPAGLDGAPYLLAHGIHVLGITEPLCVFRGNALDAAAGFPANVNVAAALALAGIGPMRTQVEIWADPGVTRNTHTIRVEAEAVARLRHPNIIQIYDIGEADGLPFVALELLDGGGLDPCPVQQRGLRGAEDLGRVQAGQRAAAPADRRAHRLDDHRGPHTDHSPIPSNAMRTCSIGVADVL